MKEYVLNKEEKSIGFGWWIILFALPIFLTAIWGVANAYEKFQNAIPGLFIIIGCILTMILAPLNKLWNSSRNRTNVYEIVRAQVVSGGLPMSLAIVGEVRFSTDVFYLVSLICMLIVVLVYLIVDDKESDLDA